MAEALEAVKRQRTTLKARATRFKNYVENYVDSNENRLILEAKLEKYNELWHEYHALQTQIDAMLPEADIAERERFEDAFFIVQASARSKLTQFRNRHAGNHVNLQDDNAMAGNAIANVNQTPVRLPVITLPTFSGNYEEWQQFQDTFKALIDDNTKLDAVQKFHYLRSALSGSAAQTIDSLLTTNDNYAIALELLTKRFQNVRLTIQHHVHELFSAPAIPKESAESLRALSDNFKKHLRVLKQLKEPIDKWDTLIIYLVTTKLDPCTKKEWELKVIQEKASKIDQLMEFLTERCEFLEALHPVHSKSSCAKQSVPKPNYNNSSKNQNITHAYATTNEANECILCKQAHRIHACKIFKDLAVESRRNEAKRLNLCYNCLGSNHKLAKCTSRTCKHCSKKHHSLLHMNEQPDVSNQVSSASSSVATGSSEASLNGKSADNSATIVSMKTIDVDRSDSEVLLSTAMVHIYDHEGKFHRVRALLDNGSQSNFITASLCKQLGLITNPVRHTISCLDQTERQTVNITRTTIASTTSTYETDVNFLVVNQITRPIPTKPVNIKSLSLPRHIELADSTFHKPQNIDLLLGATIFWDVLQADRIQVGAKQLTLQSTRLGWLVCGQIGPPLNKQSHTVCGLVRNEDLQAQLEKFWHIEECTNKRLLSPEEAKCEEIFCNNYQRTPDGRFEVPLLFRESPEVLGESRTNAFKRLQSMERKFRRNPQLQTMYIEFMNNYLQLGHMSPLSDENTRVNYLPHHAVIKEESTSTKLRVVFDASCPTTTGKSLNDCLLVGPTIQSDLFDILIRFRQHPYVLTGDITKMYRQVMVKPEHRSHQCILWRTNMNEPATTFALNTVTYGVASAPFLAIRSLYQLSIDFEHTQPQAAAVISRDFYVDDLITGAPTIQQLLELKTQVKDMLKSAGFELRKFHSNIPLGTDECLDKYELTDTKILGLLWQSNADILCYKVTCKSVSDHITKRIILSLTTQIFDPLGLIGPITIKAKILLQSLWQLKINWDTPVPETIKAEWLCYYEQLPIINQMSIPRHSILQDPIDIQLHGFCDASQAAYGACIYVRSINEAGTVKVQLLTAKSRVAPLKSTTLPRLELCGALLLANLCDKVIRALNCTIPKYYLWTDSRIALAWIQGEPSKWSIFVGNRVAEIQRLTNKESWSHVRSETNPADIISRGKLPEQLLRDALWWEGPSWLKKDFSQWPPDTVVQTISEVPEMKAHTCTLHSTNDSFDIINRYSSLAKLRRVIVTCLRFKINCTLSRSKSSLLHGPFTAEEIRNAMTVVIKLHQKDAFAQEVRNLRENKAIDPGSKILSLNPIMDQQGVLRVGGRLRNAPLSYSQKHPIILSTNDTLTDLIIRDQHLSNFHMGPQLLSTTLRQTYWIIHAKNAIKRVLRKCILCFKLRPRSLEQRMGDLPAHRVTPSRVFNNTGVDYAGPFNIKISRNKSSKAYICLFVCMATKAIHIELVSDLTTEMFLNAFKRFTSRRGKCESIWSDNGKNFLGASNMLRPMGELLSCSDFQEKTINFASTQGISWKFIPPRSPHMGGLWEANIKAVKVHLKAVINETLLSFEELYTVLTQIEAILNSRPLCPLSSAPDELEVLTPGHFLIGTSLLAVPEQSVIDVPSNRVNRYQLITQLQQSFWKRWSREYVTQMQQRTKWKNTACNNELQVGRLALIRDENLPPLKWRTGRICEIHPGADGLIRVVSLKTSGGIIQRSLPKICILPVQ